MPWFCRPSAMNKHCKIFLHAAVKGGVKPIVAAFDGENTFTGEHIFVPFEDLSNKYIAAATRRLFPDIVNQPDIYKYGTLKKAVKTIMENVNMDDVDCIHSVSFPCSSHLIAKRLVEITGKPWIAQFYDPWSDNPYRKFKTKYYRQKDLEQEGDVARCATAIIHTNEIIKKIWADRYGTQVDAKSYVLPMSYEKELYSKSEHIKDWKKKTPIVISYIGKLFFDRNLSSVISALKLLKERNILLTHRILFRVIGEVPSVNTKMIRDAGLGDVFEIIGYQPQSELEKYYIESDVFLVIDSPQAQNVFFPSKLLDYFIYKRLIIGITPNVGVTHDLLTEACHQVFDNNDILGIASFIEQILSNPDFLIGFDKEFYKKFSPEKLTKSYMDIVEKVCLHH